MWNGAAGGLRYWILLLHNVSIYSCSNKCQREVGMVFFFATPSLRNSSKEDSNPGSNRLKVWLSTAELTCSMRLSRTYSAKYLCSAIFLCRYNINLHVAG